MSIMIDIISRKTSVKQTVIEQGNTSLVVYEPSVVQIHAPVSGVERYLRQGNDLLIYMKDGSIIRVNGYFQQDPETKENSELVFEEGQTLNHVTFANADAAVGVTPLALTPQTVSISSIEPFLDTAGSASAYPWGWIVGGTLLGGGIGALLAGGGGDDNDTTVVTNPTPPAATTPSFIVTDNQGGRQGLLATGNITDDNTPTFSGSGQAGATIEIKDSNGTVIATTTVGSNGLWTVSLSPQSDGQHSWTVSQTDDGKTISAGTVTLNIDTASATITPATTAGDNIVNAAEQEAGLTLSGTSAHLQQGSEITLTLNGKTYTTEVGADGIWQVNVPIADAKALAEGLQTVTITGVDAAGNTITATQNLTVDTQAPALQINALAQDNIINAVEHNASLVMSGRTDAEVGQRVTVTLNGATHTATVGTDGTWQITLGASEVKALAEGNHTLSASVSDKAGNNVQTSSSFTVDTVAPAIAINTIAGDDILNSAEQTVAQIISGRASGAAPGDVVTLTLGSHALKGVVLGDGTWNIGVTPEIIRSLGLGAHTITVNVTDAAGNTSSATHQVRLSGVAPSVSIDPVSQDNVLNAQEAQQPLTLSGHSNLPDGSTVTVTLNNVSYTASVSGQAWSLKVPVTDVINLANTTYVVTANATDATGNTGTATANLLVDTVSPRVIINTFAGDNQVNSVEVARDQTLSGRVVGAAQGDSVSIVIDGHHYTTTVGSNLTWSINVPASDLRAMGDGPIAIEASVTNSHGNTGAGKLAIAINATLPGLGINVISGDDVVNAIEQQHDLTITGTSSHLVAGTIITLSINNVDYQAVIDSNGHWQVGIPAADLQNWTAGTVVVNASAVDSAGNPVSVNHDVLLDLSQVAITINTVSGDDLINAAEKGGPLTLTGETQAVEPGQTVVVKLAGQTFTTQVQADGTWSLLIPASTMAGLPEGQLEISATVTNVSGNTGTTVHPVTIDAQPAIISINPLTTDNIINAAEAQQPLQLTGQTNAESGQTVTVTLNNKTYQTTVGSDGSWSVTVPAADMGMLRDGNATVTATVNDVAGNVSSTSRVARVDATQPVITIGPVAGDDILNAAEHGQALVISGTTTGTEIGDLITMTLNGVDYTTVVDGSGNWSLGLPASVVSGLTDRTYTLNVSVTDRSGNTGSSTHDFAVMTTVPVVGINTIAADNVINAVEKGQDLVLSGTSGQPAGIAVTVTLNGQNYTATTDASGNWSVTVPASAVSALGEASYAITASVTDSRGNSGSASHTVRVDSALPGVTVNPVATDDIINAAEAGADQTVSGRVTGA
ncbi:TPA: Ig-like domain-containing protein, partial [Enterobacter cloacae]|nr:Ig-like domain-containing protein [Enterobacter cloacae]